MPDEPMDDLDAALARRAGPRTEDLGTTEIVAALDALGERILTGETVRPRRNRRRIAIVSAALAATVAVAAPAAANYIELHSGQFGGAGATENDTSEYLRVDSPEMPALIERYGRDYPLPPGGNYDGVIKVLRARLGLPHESDLVQDTGVRLQVAGEAACQWQKYWLDGYDHHDVAQRAAAQRILDQVPRWKVLRDNSDDDGESYLVIAVAARRADAPSLRFLYGLNCDGSISPTGPAPTPLPSVAQNGGRYLTDADRAGR